MKILLKAVVDEGTAVKAKDIKTARLWKNGNNK